MKSILNVWCFWFTILINLTGNALANTCPRPDVTKYDKLLNKCMPWEGSVCKTSADCHTDLVCTPGMANSLSCPTVQADKCDPYKKESIDKATDGIGCRNISICVVKAQKRLWEKRFHVQCGRTKKKKRKYVAAYIIGRTGPAAFLNLNDTLMKANDPKSSKRFWIANMPFLEPVALGIETKFTDMIGLRSVFGGSLAHSFQIEGPSCRDHPNCATFLLELYLEGGFFLSFSNDFFQLSFNARGIFQQTWLGSAHWSIKLENQFIGPLLKMRFLISGHPARHAFLAIEIEGGLSYVFKNNTNVLIIQPYFGLRLSVYLVPLGFTWF